MQTSKISLSTGALGLALALGTLGVNGCQQKSVIDNPANTAASPAPPRPTPTQMPLAIAGAAQPAAETASAPANASKDFDLTLLDSSQRKLSQVLGQRKVVVINFWATWCGPCRREIPDLIALQKNYQGQDVEILGLSIEDPQQFKEMVTAFSKQFEINYKVGFSPVPMFMTFNGTDPRAGIPQTFIFGKDGKLIQHIRGLRPAFRDYVQQTVDLALKSS